MPEILIILGRVFGLAAALFIGVFALDAFSDDASFWQNLVGFLIHLVPTYVLLGILAVSWRWPLAGGVIYLLIALAPLLFLSNALWVNALLAAPPALAGALLVAGALMRG